MKRTPKRSAAMVATVLAVGAVSAGCSTAADSSETALTEFTMGISVPRGWDPYDCNGGTRATSLTSVYDTLTRATVEGSVEASVATDWEYESPTRFVLTLRDDVTFADGTALDAQVVKANLERAASTPTSVTAQFAADRPTIPAVSDSEVAIAPAQPDPDLPDLFADCGGMMVHPDLVAEPERLANEVDGTGPYSFDADASIPAASFVFVKKDDYWNSEAYPFHRVTFTDIPDSNAMLSALLSDQIDVSTAGSFQAVPQAESANKSYLYGNTSQFAILLNDRAGQLVPALADERVRQALNYAIDREALTRTLFGDEGLPTPQLAMEGTVGYDAALDDRYPYDPEKAKALLAEAGYPDGFSMTVLTSTIIHLDTFLSAVADYWGRIGVDVDQKVADVSTFFAEIASTTYPAVVYPVRGMSTYSVLNKFFGPDTSFNPFGSTDEEFASSMREAAAGDEDAMQKASARLLDLGWYVGAGFDTQYFFYDPTKVEGLQWRRGDGVPLFYDWHAPED